MLPIRSHLAAAIAVMSVFAAAPAFAQSADCLDGQKLLTERHKLGEQLNGLSKGSGKKKQIDPRAACPIFTKLVANGETVMKWMTKNKDWCQVPDQVVQNFTEEQKHVQTIKGQACAAAAKFAEMEKQAKKAREQQSNGMLGGGGLTGSYSMPKGAL